MRCMRSSRGVTFVNSNLLSQSGLVHSSSMAAMMMSQIHHIILVGNVADMSPRVVATPTMSAANGRRHNVADVVTGFKAESRVGLVIYLAFLPRYLLGNFFPAPWQQCFRCSHHRNGSFHLMGYCQHITRVPMWCAPLWWRYCTAVCESRARFRRIGVWAGKCHRTNSPIVLFSLTRDIIWSF